MKEKKASLDVMQSHPVYRTAKSPTGPNLAFVTSVPVIICLKKVQIGPKRSMKVWSIQ